MCSTHSTSPKQTPWICEINKKGQEYIKKVICILKHDNFKNELVGGSKS